MSDAVLVAIISATPPTLVGVFSLLVSLRNSRQIREVHKTVNGKLGLLLTDSKAAGKQEEREEEIIRQEDKK